MNKKAVETISVNAVRDSIVCSDFLDQYIPDNDKEPSWDGSVYIYTDKSKTKDKLKGRIPVQVKGTEKDDFSKEEISFPVSTVDLKNYLNDGGAVFFVVYIGQKGLRKQIYYSELPPIKLKMYLAEAKGQKTKSIKLKKFPSDSNEKATIFFQCFENCQKQASFSNVQLLSLEEIDNIEKLERIKKEILSNEQSIPVYQESLISFDVKTIGEYKKDSAGQEGIIKMGVVLDSIIHSGMGIVDLVWEYKDLKFKSICIVAKENDEIIYDNLLTNVLESVELKQSDMTVERVKTRTEGVLNCRYNFYRWYESTNLLGMKTVAAWVNCVVYGEQNGNYKSISTYEMNTHKESALLFSAVAEIRSISFQEGLYGHLRFA